MTFLAICLICSTLAGLGLFILLTNANKRIRDLERTITQMAMEQHHQEIGHAMLMIFAEPPAAPEALQALDDIAKPLEIERLKRMYGEGTQ